MAGHSKWAQIKRKKAVTDARRGRLWSRLVKEISVSARIGGGDPDGNPRLRVAIQEAKANNVPNDNIERAIKRGTGQLDGADYEEVSYEGYAPGGVAVLVETVTDNRNRTVADIRHLFSKHGGNLGETGCVSWMFEKKGYFTIDRETMSEEQFMELALELGAEDLAIEEDSFEIYSAPEDFEDIRGQLESREVPVNSAQLAMLPQSSVELTADEAPKVLRLLEALEEQDDVQNVWANLDIDDEVLATVP